MAGPGSEDIRSEFTQVFYTHLVLCYGAGPLVIVTL